LLQRGFRYASLGLCISVIYCGTEESLHYFRRKKSLNHSLIAGFLTGSFLGFRSGGIRGLLYGAPLGIASGLIIGGSDLAFLAMTQQSREAPPLRRKPLYVDLAEKKIELALQQAQLMEATIKPEEDTD